MTRRGPPAPGVKQGNPKWSADGRQLYFVADPEDVSNVFRVDFDGHRASGHHGERP